MLYYAHLIATIVCSILAVANLGVIVRYCTKFPMTILVNGLAVVICTLAAIFNFANLKGEI